jgi:acetylornithine deacetylase/succinyl-diaminopimelate desuccinylase-like protein
MKQDLLALTKEMVAIRSVSNDGNTEISDYIEAWLKATGFDEIERLEYTYKCNGGLFKYVNKFRQYN